MNWHWYIEFAAIAGEIAVVRGGHLVSINKPSPLSPAHHQSVDWHWFIEYAATAGEIALVRGGHLCCLSSLHAYQHCSGDSFVVVSDAVVKWRGGYMPSVAERHQVTRTLDSKVCFGVP